MARKKSRRQDSPADLRGKLVKLAGYTPEQVNKMSSSELRTLWSRYLLFKETAQ